MYVRFVPSPPYFMKIAIVGSRNYPDLKEVAKYVEEQLQDGDVVISGHAFGVDRAAEFAALKRGLKVEVFPADWKKYGKKAGFIRNIDIVKAADRVVAFWDGVSKGTGHTIDIATERLKPLEIYYH